MGLFRPLPIPPRVRRGSRQQAPRSSHGSTEVPRGLQRAFWGLVLVFNIAILAFSVGVLLVVFRRSLTTGGTLVVLGTATFWYGIVRYRGYKRDWPFDTG